jgi:uncharacterized membrane protein YccC
MSGSSDFLRRLRDRALASDPGLTRLQTATSAVVGMATALGVEYTYAHFTHAGAQGTLIAMLLGAVTAMMGSMALSGTGVWLKVRTAVFFPVAMGLGMLAGIAVGGNTDLMLTVFVVVMFLAVFVRRFGVAFFFYGFMIWMGYFFAAFMHATLTTFPSLLAEIAIATAWVLLLSITVLRTSPKNTLRRTRRAFKVRSRMVARACAGLLEAEVTDPGQVKRWQSRIRAAQTRLAESALMIEAWSAELPTLPGGFSPSSLRRMILDAQLAIDGLVTATEGLRGADTRLQVEAARILGLFGAGDYVAADRAARRLLTKPGRNQSDSRRLVCAIAEYVALIERADDPRPSDDFEPAVTLALGNLPGSVSAAGDVKPRGGSWNPLLRLSLTSRQAVQVAVAGALAIVAGRELSEARYYWAVIAAFVAFTGTATRSEVFIKATNRVVGTLVGLGAGIGLAHLTAGSTTWVLVVIVGAMFCGFYLQRLSYAYMIFFITIMVSQLYSALHEFSAGLLVLRLEETALGATIGIVVALLLTPLSTRDTVSTVESTFLGTLAELLRAAGDRIENGGHEPDLDARTRSLDNGLRQLLLVAAPLVGALPWGSGSRRTRHRLTLYSGIAGHTRGLAGTLRRRPTIEHALAVPCRALAEAVTALAEGPKETALAQLGAAELALAQPWTPDAERVWQELVNLRQLLYELATGNAEVPIDEKDENEVPQTPVAQVVPTSQTGLGGIRIRGFVRAADGSGVDRAVLTLIDRRGRQVARGVSRADGRYRVEAPRAGTFVLITAAEAHRPSASTVTVRKAAGTVVVDVLLSDSGGLVGTVTSGADGTAVEGALTTLTDSQGMVAGSRRTGAEGAYAFSALDDGDYTLVVKAASHQPAARTVTVTAGGDTREDVALTGVTRLSGVVTAGPDAHPASRVRITLLDAAGAVVALTDTDDAGRYTFEGLPEGRYTTLARGYPPAVSTLHLSSEGHPLRHDVELKHSAG